MADQYNMYNDPIVVMRRKGTINDPYKRMSETLTISNGHILVLTL